MIITKKFLESGITGGGGINQKQLELLNIEWPPRKGWKFELIGNYIPDDVAKKFISLKGVKKKKNKQNQNNDVKEVDNTYEFIGKYLSYQTEVKDFDREIYIMKSYKITGLVHHLIKEMSYANFLKTPYWKIISAYKKQQSKFKCQLCNSGKNLSVHHRSYDNHGDELNHLEDLVVLCQNCHNTFHNRGK